MARGSCPLCGVVFTEHAAYRVHLNEVHLLYDDPGTESRLPELVALPDEPEVEEPDVEEPGELAVVPDRQLLPDAQDEVEGPTAGALDVPEPEPERVLQSVPQSALQPVPEPQPQREPQPALQSEPGAEAGRERAPDSAPALVPPSTDGRTGGRFGRSPDGPRRWVVLTALVLSTVGLIVVVGSALRADGPAADASEPPPVTVPASTQPAGEPDEAGEPAGESDTYLVQRGDTLSAIARQAGVSVEALAAENGITDPNLIHAGQVLRIPGAGG